MSDKPGGAGKGRCDVCFRVYTWGCGHSGSQERDARRHNQTKKHADRECECYGHDHCDKATCDLAGIHISGYMPFYQHTKKAGCEQHSDCEDATIRAAAEAEGPTP